MKPNGTINCDNPAHGAGEPPPPGLRLDERIRWVVDHAPPLTSEQRDKLALLLNPGGQA